MSAADTRWCWTGRRQTRKGYHPSRHSDRMPENGVQKPRIRPVHADRSNPAAAHTPEGNNPTSCARIKTRLAGSHNVPGIDLHGTLCLAVFAIFDALSVTWGLSACHNLARECPQVVKSIPIQVVCHSATIHALHDCLVPFCAILIIASDSALTAFVGHSASKFVWEVFIPEHLV